MPPSSPHSHPLADSNGQALTCATWLKEVAEVVGVADGKVSLGCNAFIILKEQDVRNTKWIFDYGASLCIANDRAWFSTLRCFPTLLALQPKVKTFTLKVTARSIKTPLQWNFRSTMLHMPLRPGATSFLPRGSAPGQHSMVPGPETRSPL